MPVVLKPERRSPRTRLIVAAIYLLLALGATTMIYPFMITAASSFTNDFDYHRFEAVPRSLHSRSDRFVRGLVGHFRVTIPDVLFPGRPSHWTTAMAIGRDKAGIDAFAARYLAAEKDGRLETWRRIAADYADFFLDYDIRDTECSYDFRDLAPYLRDTYVRRLEAQVLGADAGLSGRKRGRAALALLNAEWGVPYLEFFDITMDVERVYPMHHVSWDYPDTPKALAFLDLKNAYRCMVFQPGAEGQWSRYFAERGGNGTAPWPVTAAQTNVWPMFKAFVGARSPAGRTRPYLMKPNWLRFLNRLPTRKRLGLERAELFTVEDYNRLFDANYECLVDVPFPVPPDAHLLLHELWERFVIEFYPARLLEIVVTPELQRRYQDALRLDFKTIENYNRVMSRANDDISPVDDFESIVLEPRGRTQMWKNFVRTVPLSSLRVHSSEAAYQRYLLDIHGSLAGVNAAYAWDLRRIEEARIPFAEAYAVTFLNNEWRYFLNDISKNYKQVFDFLFIRGRAFFNTILIVILAILATLIVNPMAAYALSRFRLRFTEQILLFLLATMAFPAAVRAIPGFLLMRDLGLLNTYAALILPGMANGMSIFILKCFFDGLPRELYEAAAIDGASELQVFVRITLPLTAPILAINSLNAFIQAYNAWQWALLVCQDKDYWTLAVWLYQMQTIWQAHPYVLMAGFVIASVPTAIVFIACQKIILRGIVIPSMK